MALYTYRARLATSIKNPIYDTDTVRLVVDLGFGLTSELGPCCLYGIDVPEMRGSNRPRGIAARDWLRELLEPQDDGTNVNEALVTAGHAVVREY